MFSYRLQCRRCGWQTVCGHADAVARLRLIGMLRRETDPDEEIAGQLLVEAAGRMTCPTCKEKSLQVAPIDVEDDADQWQAAVLCELCRRPIPPERLAALPEVRRCVDCQGQAEAGATEPDVVEYCPKCGAPLETRVSRGGGITRYKQSCTGSPPCRL